MSDYFPTNVYIPDKTTSGNVDLSAYAKKTQLNTGLSTKANINPNNYFQSDVIDAGIIRGQTGSFSSGLMLGNLSIPSNNITGTITLPTTTDTLIGRISNDTLLNKTLNDNSNTVYASGLRTSGWNYPLNATTPTTNQVLSFDGSNITWTNPPTSSLTGTLSGDVSGNTNSTVVNSVGGKTASQIATSVTRTSNATSFPFANTLVLRDGFGGFSSEAGSFSSVNTANLRVNNTTLVGSALIGSLTLPDVVASSDVLVGRNTTDTIINKTIRSNTNDVASNALRNGSTFTNLSTTAPSSGQILQFDGTNAVWTNITGGLGQTGTSVSLSSITGDNLNYTNIHAQNITGTSGVFNTLSVASMTTTTSQPINLISTNAVISNLTGTTINATTLNSVNSNPTNLVSTNITGTNIRGVNATISNVTSTSITGTNISAVNIRGGTLQTNNTTLNGNSLTGTLSLPSSSDTLVGRATGDVLTNKTLVSNTNNISANSLRNGNTFVNLTTTAPTTGQVLSFDGFNAVWSNVSGEGTDIIATNATVTNFTGTNATVTSISGANLEYTNGVIDALTGGIINASSIIIGADTQIYSVGTVSQAGTTITGVGTTFTTNMIGGILTFANGQQVGIAGFTSATVLTADTSQTVASQNYNIKFGRLSVSPTGFITVPPAGIMFKSSTAQQPTTIRGGANTTANTLILPTTAGTNSQVLSMGTGNQLGWTSFATGNIGNALVQRDVNGNVGGGGLTTINTASGWTQRNYNALALPVSTVTNNSRLFASYTLPSMTGANVASSFRINVQVAGATGIGGITGACASSKHYVVDVDNTPSTNMRCVPKELAGTDFLNNDYDLNVEITTANPAVVNFRLTRTRGTLIMLANAQIQMIGMATTTISSPNTLSTITIPTAVYKGAGGALTMQDTDDPSKVVTFDLTGISSGGITGYNAVTRTWRFPDNSDTFVGITGTQTLTNKTLTQPTISQIRNLNGALIQITPSLVDDVLVARDTTDTLTNKTLRNTTNNIASNALRNGTTLIDLSATPPSSGQVLQFNGTNAVWSNITGSSGGSLGNSITLNNTTINGNSTTGTLSLPSSTDTLVGRNTVDTLTNKTLTAPILTGSILASSNIFEITQPTANAFTIDTNGMRLHNINFVIPTSTTVNNTIEFFNQQIGNCCYELTVAVSGYDLSVSKMYKFTSSYDLTGDTFFKLLPISESQQVGINNDFDILLKHRLGFVTLMLRKTSGINGGTVYITLKQYGSTPLQTVLTQTLRTDTAIYSSNIPYNNTYYKQLYGNSASFGSDNQNALGNSYGLLVSETTTGAKVGSLCSMSDGEIASFKTNNYQTFPGSNEALTIWSPLGSGSTRINAYVPMLIDTNTTANALRVNGAYLNQIMEFPSENFASQPANTVNFNILGTASFNSVNDLTRNGRWYENNTVAGGIIVTVSTSFTSTTNSIVSIRRKSDNVTLARVNNVSGNASCLSATFRIPQFNGFEIVSEGSVIYNITFHYTTIKV